MSMVCQKWISENLGLVMEFLDSNWSFFTPVNRAALSHRMLAQHQARRLESHFQHNQAFIELPFLPEYIKLVGGWDEEITYRYRYYGWDFTRKYSTRNNSKFYEWSSTRSKKLEVYFQSPYSTRTRKSSFE